MSKKIIAMLPVIYLVLCEVLWCYVTPKGDAKKKSHWQPYGLYLFALDNVQAWARW